MAYYHMFAVCILLLYNMLCGLFALFCGYLGDMIISCLVLLIGTAIVFFTYRRLYNASRVGSSFSYGIFLLGMIFEIIIDIMGMIGWSNTGFLGLKNGIDLMHDDKKFVGTMCVINGILWIVSLGFDVFMFFTVRQSFKKAGGMDAFKKQAADKTGKAVVGYIKEHPDQAKEAGKAVGKAAVDYARENPDVARDIAVSAARESQPLLH